MKVAKVKRLAPVAKSTPTELTCKEEVNAIGDFLSASLSVERRFHFERHLEGCPECAVFLRTYEKTIAAMRHNMKSYFPPTPVLKLRKPPPQQDRSGRVNELLN